MKVTIPRKIQAFADQFGIEFRVGAHPSDVGINVDGLRFPDYYAAAYFGEGVIWVRSPSLMKKDDIPFALLHEVGHALLDFFPLKLSEKAEEIKANGIALALAAQLGIPVSRRMVRLFGDYTRTRRLTLGYRKPKRRAPEGKKGAWG